VTELAITNQQLVKNRAKIQPSDSVFLTITSVLNLSLFTAMEDFKQGVNRAGF
jgi:hypothetical protein